MSLPATCSTIFLATGIGAPGDYARLLSQLGAVHPHPDPKRRWAAAMTVSDTDEELMTRRQVAYLFRETSAAVAKWAQRGLLPEVHNGAGRPRYRRADVEELLRSGFRRRAR